MKLLCTLLLLLDFYSFAQTKSFKELTDQLPDGWTLSASDTLLTITYKDSITSAYGNWINASIDHMRLQNDSSWIAEHGKKMIAKFVLKIIPRLNEKEIEDLKLTDPKYSGRFAKYIYCYKDYSLLEISFPPTTDQYTAAWPLDYGGWKVKNLLSNVFDAY